MTAVAFSTRFYRLAVAVRRQTAANSDPILDGLRSALAVPSGARCGY
jgi:hypothetical protein